MVDIVFLIRPRGAFCRRFAAIRAIRTFPAILGTTGTLGEYLGGLKRFLETRLNISSGFPESPGPSISSN